MPFCWFCHEVAHLLALFFNSFEKDDIFVVNNEMGDGWLWVVSQRTGEEGQVFEELVEDLVCMYFILDIQCLYNEPHHKKTCIQRFTTS